MVLTTIYITRHGFRLNWTVDPHSGTYTALHSSPTGIPSDPPLAAHGVTQSEQLAKHLLELHGPSIDTVYSSPFYRCLQTLSPYIHSLNNYNSSTPNLGQSQLPPEHQQQSPRPPKTSKAVIKVHGENGLGEWYGHARFTHPSPAGPHLLNSLFPFYDESYTPVIVPSTQGETVDELHDRCAYALERIIAAEDAKDVDAKGEKKQRGERAILICTHAASLIAMGRALTGKMPEDVTEDDFKTYTCGLSRFDRRQNRSKAHSAPQEEKESVTSSSGIPIWKPGMPIPSIEWKGGRGVGGGWDCITNSDCSFLKDGEERGWHFHGDEDFEDFSHDNDNATTTIRNTSDHEPSQEAVRGGSDGGKNQGTRGRGHGHGSRL